MHANHGGDILSFVERYGAEPLDFSANTNPLGPSPAAIAAATRALAQADRYPDPRCRALVRAIAQHEGVDASAVVCGNGASDLIWRIATALAPERALLCAPTFSEYEEALRSAGCAVTYHDLRDEDGFAPTEALADDVDAFCSLGGRRVVFLCEPNNPTGICTPRPVIDAVIARCAQAGATVVVDECFNGFLDDPAAHTVVPLVATTPNLVVLKAHTKIYGMAGLRLGYALCSDARAIECIAQTGPTWPVSTIAQEAGVAAFADVDYLDRARAIIAAERPRLAAALREAGCRVYPSEANYLLVEAPCASFGDDLARRGILVRPCANYRGLTDRHFRIAVRTPADNDKLIERVSLGRG